MEGEGFAVFGAGVAKAGAIQTKRAATNYFGGGLIFQQFKFRQHAKLNLLFQNEILLLNFLVDQLPLQIEPCGLGFGDHTGIVEGNQFVGIQQGSTVAALGAENGVALGCCGVLLAATGAPEQQIFQILGAVVTNVIMVFVDLIP